MDGYLLASPCQFREGCLSACSVRPILMAERREAEATPAKRLKIHVSQDVNGMQWQ